MLRLRNKLFIMRPCQHSYHLVDNPRLMMVAINAPVLRVDYLESACFDSRVWLQNSFGMGFMGGTSVVLLQHFQSEKYVLQVSPWPHSHSGFGLRR